jgi:beta-lactamase regulating signal transducer with metallopeptidase domain
MKGARRFYLLTLALGALGAAAATLALTTAAGSLRPDLPALAALAEACRRVVTLRPDLPSLLVLALAAIGAAVVVRGARSLGRHWRAQLRFRRRLRIAGSDRVGRTTVIWVDDARPRAFCAGLLRPRVHISVGAREVMSTQELEAVVAHERHHARRRDPLRLLVVSALAESLFFMPALSGLADRYRALAELAADEAAIRESERAVLASALLAFGRHDNPQAVAGVAPERVDHLLGRPHEWRLPASVMSASVLALVAVLAVVVATEAVVGAGGVGLAETLVSACSASMLAVPLMGLLLTTDLLRSLGQSKSVIQ